MSGQYQERKEYFKQYREKNKERLQQERHDYYEENKDRIKEYSKQWKHWQDNPSMVWLQKQEYFEKNKDKINESRRRKCAENKEQINHKKKNTEKLRKPKISQFEIILPYSKVLLHLWL